MYGPIIGWRHTVVHQAIYCLRDETIYKKGYELEGGNGSGGRICDWADVGRAQGTGFDSDEEAADREQKGRYDVARGAVIEEVEQAIERVPRL